MATVTGMTADAINTALALKANSTDLTSQIATVNATTASALALKADSSAMTTALAAKVDTTTLTADLALKVDTTTLTTDLALKADLSAVLLKTNNLSDVSNVATARANLNVSQRLYFNVRDYGAVGNGTTDDTTSIQNAISAAITASGGVVFVPDGTYKLTSGLTLWTDNIVIRGETRTNTILKPTSGFTNDVILTPLPPTVGTAGYTQSNVGVETLTIDGSNMTSTTAGHGNGIHLYGGRDSFIRNVNIVNCPNLGILLDGDATNTSYNMDVRNNIINGGGGGIWANFASGYIEDNQILQANVTMAAAQPAFGTTSNVGYLARIMSGYWLIRGNIFSNGGTYTSAALRLESGIARVIGNQFDQCRYQAINILGNGQIIEGNQIGNPSSVGSVEGITITSTSNTIVGNAFDISKGAAHYTYCISESAAESNNNIQDNQVKAGITGTINLNASSTGNRVHNNIGYNPKGNITAPTVPATTVTFTNNYGSDATVYISGGTVTVISIGGVTTGAIAGTFRLSTSQTIAITYSVVPTWKWFLD